MSVEIQSEESEGPEAMVSSKNYKQIKSHLSNKSSAQQSGD